MRLLEVIKFEPLDYPFDRRMALELQAYFVEDDWETDFVEEPWLSEPNKFQLDGTHPDVGGYHVYPTVLEARKGKYAIRVYFIRASRFSGDDNERIRICSVNRKHFQGYLDGKICMGDTAAEAWRAFNITFKQKQ